jgi:hypothetical protein
MKAMNLFLALSIGLTMTLGAAGDAQARNARGARLWNTNHPDPTVAPHRHKDVFTSRKATKEQACCVWKPMIDAMTCVTCGRERRFDPSTGRLNPRIYFPRR